MLRAGECKPCAAIARAADRKLRRAVALITEAVKDTRAAYPDAEAYADENSFYLLSGNSHDGRGHRQDRILTGPHTAHLFGAGGW